MEEESKEVVASTCTVLTSTVSSTSAPITQRTQSNHTDRQAVQVIQQAVHRPAGVAQYLQQMYTAQQHHIMLQTLRQHQQTTSPTTHTTASIQQSNSKKTASPPLPANGSAAQNAIPLPSTAVTQHQSPSVSGSAGAISQQTVLLGNGSVPCSQAQMYLRTQMLILAPASVAADLPALSSVSSQTASTQVPSLALRTHLPGALSTAQSVQLKASQGQTLVTPLPRMSICPLKSTQLSQALAETSRTLMRHPLHCPPGQKGASPQFILQSSVAQRQVQPIALRVTAQDGNHTPLSLLSGTTSTPASVLSQHCEVISGPTALDQPANQSSAQQQALVASTSTVPLPDPPPLHLGPVVDPLCQTQSLSSPPPPPPLTLALPRLSTAPHPSSVQRLSLRSVHALAVQSDHVLLSEDELPVAEALAQLPFQQLPPPQTTAVDLKVQPNTNAETASEDGAGIEVLREKEQKCPDKSRTPTPPALTPTVQSPTEEPQNSCSDATRPEPGLLEPSCLQPSRSVIRSSEVAESTSPPPSIRPAVRSFSSSPPQASVRPHILTHLIEGFVITEGLEPFPVGRTSLDKKQHVRPPENQELQENGEPEQHDFLLDTEQPENSSESDMDNIPAEDERSEVSPLDLLQCEFCGKRGYSRTFLRSKRFCSTTCARSFNISSTKRLAVLRAHRVTRWPNRPMGRRGRPPSRISRTHREHSFQQMQGCYRPDSAQQVSISSLQPGEDDCEDEDSPSPMTTRLRLQSEREREREQEGRERVDCSSSTGLLDCSPALWSVEQVCSYISSLPGCQDMVAEFRSQEIDGQALLLLTEEHLMSAMNIKLGPALKVCAHISSLKQP